MWWHSAFWLARLGRWYRQLGPTSWRRCLHETVNGGWNILLLLMFPSGKSFPAQSVQDGRATFTQVCCCFWILYASLVTQMVKNLPAIQETQVRSLGQKDPVEKEMATCSSILVKENLLDRGAWWATYSPWGHKESDMTEWLTLSTWILYRIWACFRALLASLQAQTVKNLPAMRETWVRSLGQKIPWRAWQPTPAFLPGEAHGQRSLAGYSPWGRKELDKTEQLSLTHSHSGPSTRVYS